MNTFILVLASMACILVALLGQVQAQDELSVEMMYDLSQHFNNSDSFLQGVLRDNDTVYVFTQLAPEIFVFNISDITVDLQQGDLASKFMYPQNPLLVVFRIAYSLKFEKLGFDKI